MRRTFLTALCVTALLFLGSSATAAPVTRALTTAAPTPTPSPTDPLAAQIQAAAAQQQLIDAAKQSLTDEITAAKSEQSNLVTLILSNQTQIATTLQQIAQSEQADAAATAEAQQENAIAANARAQEVIDKELLAGYMRQSYTSHDDVLSFVLAGSSLQAVMERAASITQATGAAKDLVVKVRNDVTIAEDAAAKAQTAADAAAAATAALSAQRDTLLKQTQQAQSLISQLNAQEQAAAAEIAQADSQDANLAEQIANMRIQQIDNTIAQAETADWQAAEYYIQQHLGDFPGFSGAVNISAGNGSTPLIWPAPGTAISQPFGPSPYPFEPPLNGYPHFHTGIDLAGALGSPIYAPADGIVVAASAGNTGYGNHIIIAHPDGMLTLYGHLESMVVQPGQHVRQGQLIGLLGSTGNSTGPHCHFEVRINNVPVNPMPFLPPLPPGATGPPPGVPA